MNITEPIRRQARVRPDSAAIIRADGSIISFGALERAIDVMADRARQLGLAAGDIAALGIAGPDESLGITLALALARIGVASADPGVPNRHLRVRFRADAKGDDASVGFDAGWMTDVPPPPGHVAPPIHRDANAICRIYASSGTTGRPKHVVVTHRQTFERIMGRWLGDGGGPAIRIAALGLGGMLGFDQVLRTLWAGGTVVLSNPRHASAAIVRHGVTSIVASPAALRAILDALPDGAGPFPTLRMIEVRGSALPPALYRIARERLCPDILHALGSSEASEIASAPVNVLSRPDAVGYVLPGVEVEALDGAGHPLPPGSEGVLRIRSSAVAAGYLEPPDGPDRFEGGWFYSSDIGTVWPDGMLTLSGRTTDVINAGGVKVHPKTIETALLKLPTVLDAAAFGVPDEVGMTRIWTAVVALARIDDAVLKAFCRRALPDVPLRTIVQVKVLPRNENGKVLRAPLVDMALRIQRQAVGQAP